MKSRHLLLFLAIYTLLFFILFPGYRYILDPDANGYFSVAERLAGGDFHDSFNGIWSPLGSWMLVPLIKLHFDEILSAKYLNGLYGFLSLIAFFYFLVKFKIRLVLQKAIMIVSVLLILHFVFYRLFGDLLQLLLLLLYLNIICSKKFSNSYKEIVLAAFIGGVAFYAKAYAFYFILIHLPVAIYLSGIKNIEKKNDNRFIKKTAVAIVVLIMTVSPWLIALNFKYGHYIPGRQNITGSLSPAYHQPRVPFYPPPSPNAYSIFDDISYLKIHQVTPFTNRSLFLAQLKLIAFNILKIIEHFNDFSFSFLIIIIAGGFLFIGRGKSHLRETNSLLLLSFIIIWPLGFLLFHVEPRFLWIMILVNLVLAGILFSCLNEIPGLDKKYFRLFGLVIIASFCLYPIIQLKDQYGGGKNYFEIANALKQNNISGNILYSNQSNEDLSKSVIVNYLIKGRQYGPFTKDYTTPEILQAVATYKINYFVFYYASPYQKEMMLSSTLASNASTILKDVYPGVIVLRFN